MKKIILPAGLIILITAALVVSCRKKWDNGNASAPGGSDILLTNLGANIVIPAYTDLDTKITALQTAVTTFNGAPTVDGLTLLRTAFVDAYKSWAGCSEFEFGPATDKSLTTHFVNSFPTDTVTINKNLAGAGYAIDGIGNFAAQGFPAIDFLLYSGGSGTVVARFTRSGSAAGAKSYLLAIVQSLKTKTDAVLGAWSASGGNYLATFEAGTGVDAGSSLSLFVNAFVQDFDVNLQNFKIGIPIGIYGPSTLPKSPGKVEGFYGGLSDQLLIAQVQAYQKIYTGGSGHGLQEKVQQTGVEEGGVLLSQTIADQFTALLAKVQSLPEPLSDGITSGNGSIGAAFTEVRKTTVLLKSDMPSALGVKISFADDDGD